MTDHLPECPIQEHWDSNWDCPTYCDGGCESAECICPALRACEQRVRDEHSEVDAYRGWVKGYVAGVSAAYEAVLNAGLCAPHRCQSDALAAIDALRGEA